MNDSSKIFDGLLVLQYRSGNEKAFGLLVNRYHTKLCKYSYGYTHDIEASKDIVQDSWHIITKKIHGLKNPNLFGSWAFRIVTRRTLNYIQKEKRELVKLQAYYDTTNGIEDLGNKGLNIKRMLQAIQSLTKDQQVVIRLFYTENYSLKEISTILHISLGTVKSRLFHAREKLKILLKEY